MRARLQRQIVIAHNCGFEVGESSLDAFGDRFAIRAEPYGARIDKLIEAAGLRKWQFEQRIRRVAQEDLLFEGL